MEDKTTKAAKCPSCGVYSLVASIQKYNKKKGVRKDFAEMLVDGFEIIEVSTEDAKKNFGYCDCQLVEPEGVQLSIF